MLVVLVVLVLIQSRSSCTCTDPRCASGDRDDDGGNDKLQKKRARKDDEEEKNDAFKAAMKSAGANYEKTQAIWNATRDAERRANRRAPSELTRGTRRGTKASRIEGMSQEEKTRHRGTCVGDGTNQCTRGTDTNNMPVPLTALTAPTKEIKKAGVKTGILELTSGKKCTNVSLQAKILQETEPEHLITRLCASMAQHLNDDVAGCRTIQ